MHQLGIAAAEVAALLHHGLGALHYRGLDDQGMALDPGPVIGEMRAFAFAAKVCAAVYAQLLQLFQVLRQMRQMGGAVQLAPLQAAAVQAPISAQITVEA
jgi:hypothetical protein